MNRGKSEFKKAVRISLVLEEEHYEYVKKAAIQLSVEEDRLITPSEAMRMALKKCYPMPKENDLTNKPLNECKVG
ncbi:MAG: hypothetical protein JSR85_09060 [Proteobacteria bacterium]|nr:hypothetical protein [Pseudomonadota bacterium]